MIIAFETQMSMVNRQEFTKTLLAKVCMEDSRTFSPYQGILVQITFCWDGGGVYLCIFKCSRTSLVSTHWMPK